MTAKANGMTHHAPVRGKARCNAKAQNAVTTTARAVGDVNEMRRAGFALLTASMAAAACGRIVTVPKTGANGGLVPAGNMLIRYRVQGVLDFTNLRYLVVFNTSGNGITPYAPSLLNTSYLNYSFILVFGGTSVGGASFGLLQVIPIASGGFQTVGLQINSQFVTSFNANSSGQGNEFTFTFNRLLLTPLQSTSPTPTSTPTAGPTSVPTLLSGVSSLWALNAFSADANNNPIDAIAFGGTADTTFSSFIVNTLAPFDVPVNKAAGSSQVANLNAQLAAVEVINQP
jgi:hypothetical protein